MRVLLIHQGFCTPNEPGSTRHFELCRYLVKKGHKVVVIGGMANPLTMEAPRWCRRKFLFKENVEGVEILRAFTISKPKQSFIKRIISYLSFMISSIIVSFCLSSVDLVIACSPQIFTGISGYVVSRVKKIPFIFEIRDLWPDFAIEEGILRGRFKIQIAKCIEKFIYKKAHYFIINSPGYFSHLAKFGIDKKRIIFVPNGVDTDIFKPGKKNSHIRKQLRLDGKFVVLYAGAHGQANNLKTVIEAAKLIKNNKDIVFLLVGDGKEKRDLINLSRYYSLENVIFLDPQPRERMPEICAASDVCLAILKKNYKTTYPNKIFDYMASGRAIILAIDGVARKVIEKANAGVFVEPENPKALKTAILNLYHHRELLGEYGVNARKYVVKYFDRQKIAEHFHQALTKIIRQ